MAKTQRARPPESAPLQRRDLSDARLLALYEALVLPRLIDETMLVLLRQGRVSKWFSGIGQEAIAVGSTAALRRGDFILPLHRNLGVFTTRGLPLRRLFAQWQGKPSGYTKGRDRSFHFGAPQHGIVGMISHLGSMLPVADGLALAARLRGADDVTLVYSGDAGASEGDFHEALNVAAVWDLPVIFLVENNGYGLSTPSSEQFRCARFADKGSGYGIEGVRVDGNDLLAVYHAVSDLAASMRQRPRPVLLEAVTFRMRGHEEASGFKYVPPELLDAWRLKDPVVRFEKQLLSAGVLGAPAAQAIRSRLKNEIDAAWEIVFAEADGVVDAAAEVADVYAPASTTGDGGDEAPVEGPPGRFVDAIAAGLRQAMHDDPKLVLMGQDIAEYGGVFKVTEGLMALFGRERVRNTPLCESGILGASLGLAIAGFPSVVEMQFADFVSCGFNQIVNNLAKTHYRWGQPVNVTVRLPTGAGAAAGPFHSQSNEAWFTHVPGLKVVFPATPADAKGLLLAAVRDPNPVLFFEHKLLYRSLEGPVPNGAFAVPLGRARIARAGSAATVVTYGAAVHWALAAVARLGVDVEVIDLRSLLPWDQTTVARSVRKTARVLVLHEDTLCGGFGGEVAAWIGEHLFDYLDAPVLRLAALDTPVPFVRPLENEFLPRQRVDERLRALLAY